MTVHYNSQIYFCKYKICNLKILLSQQSLFTDCRCDKFVKLNDFLPNMFPTILFFLFTLTYEIIYQSILSFDITYQY